MSLYFLHVRDGTSEILDPEGSELATFEELRDRALRSARELMVDGMQRGVLDFRYRIDAEDADHNLVFSLPFRHAVTLIQEAANSPGPTALSELHSWEAPAAVRSS